MLARCKICGDLLVGWKDHICNPKWWIRPEDDCEAVAVFAWCAQAAVERFAEDQATFGDYDGDPMEVTVWPDTDRAKVQVFNVEGEMDIVYRATEEKRRL